MGVEPASIAKTLLDGSFCDLQSNAGNIDSVLQTLNLLTMRLGSICNKKGQSRLHAGDLALLCYILQ